MEARENSEQRNLEIYRSVQRLRWLVGLGVILGSFALAAFVVLKQQGTHSVLTQQEQVCNKFKGGIPTGKDIDIASTGLIPGTQTISDELQKIQVQLATLRNRFTDYHPEIVKLKERKAAIEKLLLQRVESTCQALK